MSHLDLSGGKKKKRGDRVFKFSAFGEQGYPVEWNGSFQQNVQALLELGERETGFCCTMEMWSFQLEVQRCPSVYMFLFVIEEPIELSVQHHCKQCQYIGWGHHLICNKKYHFVLPSKDTVAACTSYDPICNTDPRECKSKHLIELQGHSMHGVFHSNGFGHLQCVNGMETSCALAAYQIMEFWDRLCNGLGARKVSLKDVIHEKGMELRLLHTVAYNEPWFGCWGYTFGRGSYGIDEQTYRNAIVSIQQVPLTSLTHQFGSPENEMLITLSRYQMLSGHTLITLGDLFHFILELKSHLPKESSLDNSNYLGIMSDASCRWSSKRVEMAIRVVIEALKKAEFRWISRQEVRDAARIYVGDTGLLDFVLKSLGNQIVGQYFVRRCLNPVTKVLEYCLEDISPALPKQGAKTKPQYKITWAQLMKDLFYLYKHVLNGTYGTIPFASRIILDCKHLVKEYYGDLNPKLEPNNSYILCSVNVVTQTELGLEKITTPYECFELKNNTTLEELRVRVQTRFREMYFGLRNFAARPMFGNGVSPKGAYLVKPLDKVIFEAEGVVNVANFEGLISSIVVDCPCGARDEDGERMVSCEICEVWQHTRCVQIPNNEEIPNIFICNMCEHDMLQFPSIP